MKSKRQGYHARRKAYWAKVSDKMRKRAKRAWPKRHAEMAEREPDPDTVRWRALQDRKGSVAADFCANQETYTIRHSKRRTDAYDVLQAGNVVCSGGRVVVGRFLASLLP